MRARQERAAELVAEGPPFDPRSGGFERHSVFVGPEDVVFVFEGSSLERLVELLGASADASVLGAWEEIDGMPRVAPEAYGWVRPPDRLAPGL